MSTRNDIEQFLASPLGKFKPWRTPSGTSPQTEFLKAAGTHRTRVYRGGNRSGKTTVGVVDALLRCLGWHPFTRTRPPVLGWVVSLDWENGVGGIIWPKMKPMLPMNRVRSIAWQRKQHPEIPTAITFDNGSQLVFKSAEARIDKFAGVKLDFAWCDEEQDQGIIEEVRARLIDLGGDFWTTLTPVARKAWVRDMEREADTKVIRASMRDAADAGIINRDAVDKYLAALPERQRRVRELGEFASLEGLVYPDFNRETHVLRPRGRRLWLPDGRDLCEWPLPNRAHRYAAMDFGYSNPSSVPSLVEEDSGKHLIVDRCLYAPGVRVSRWAHVIQELIPPLSAPIAADWDAFERAELASHGVATTPAFKEIVPGIEAVERALYPNQETGLPRLLFVLNDQDPPTHPTVGRYDAHWLAWELEGYRYPERREGRPDSRDLPVKKDDHACDALRYLIMSLERRRMGDPLATPELPPAESVFNAPPRPGDPHRKKLF